LDKIALESRIQLLKNLIMKRIILIFALGFALQGKTWAQGTFFGSNPPAPDQNFNINFATLSGSPTEDPLTGNAVYSLIPVIGPIAFTTNHTLNVYIMTGTTEATDAQIVRMGSNGSLTQIAEMNVFPSPIISPEPIFLGYNYYCSQQLQLTSDQIEGLLYAADRSRLVFGSGL
jgi:hypothetical protein